MEYQNLPEMGCLRIQYQFKPNFHTLKSVFFRLHKNINFGHIFDDLGNPLAGGKSDIFSKVNFGSSQTNIGLNPRISNSGVHWLGSLRQVAPPPKKRRLDQFLLIKICSQNISWSQWPTKVVFLFYFRVDRSVSRLLGFNWIGNSPSCRTERKTGT